MAAIIPSLLLTELFGPAAKGVGNLIKGFDFSKMNVKESSRDDYLHVSIAPSYGALNAETIKALDDNVKIAIAGTIRSLNAIPEQDRSWESFMSKMMQSPLLKPEEPGKEIARTDSIIKSGTNVFKFDGSPDAAIVKEVQSWYHNLIKDEDVLKSSCIDINTLAAIVAQTGATVDSFETLLAKTEQHEKTMVDVGVLGFPDSNQPFFKLYRIKLVAWSQSKRVLMVQEDQNGINGEYRARKFYPNSELINGMSDDVKSKAIGIADSLFN